LPVSAHRPTPEELHAFVQLVSHFPQTAPTLLKAVHPERIVRRFAFDCFLACARVDLDSPVPRARLVRVLVVEKIGRIDDAWI